MPGDTPWMDAARAAAENDHVRRDAVLFGGALLARLLVHHRLVSLHRRPRFWGRDLLWEVPTAVAMAFVGHGAAAVLDMEGAAALGLVGVMSFLGPRGLEALLFSVARQYALQDDTPSEGDGDLKGREKDEKP